MANNRKVFAYDDPPETGNPGDEINCRCVALPIYDESVKTAKEEEQAEHQENQIVKSYLDPRDYKTYSEYISQTSHIREATLKYKLSESQVISVYSYTTEQFFQINSKLRSDRLEKSDRDFIKLITKSLNKLPNFKGVVYRDTELSQAILEKYQVGETVFDKAFTSCSKIEDSEGFTNGNVKMIIKSKTGKVIEDFSQYKKEQEVLFKPKTKFKVLNRREEVSKSGRITKTIITLEEI